MLNTPPQKHVKIWHMLVAGFCASCCTRPSTQSFLLKASYTAKVQVPTCASGNVQSQFLHFQTW